jgi:hypothetical protein
MLAGRARPEANLLSAFALAIVGALATGLPMGVFLRSTGRPLLFSRATG